MNPSPPSQLPADLRLKSNPDLRRKRYTEAPEEGEIGPSKGSKQQRQSQTKKARGSAPLIAEKSFLWLKCAVQPAFGLLSWRWTVHPLPGMPPSSITVGGHAGHVAEALEQPLLLPKDMEAYRSFTHPELFLSLKRDLAMVSYLIHRSI